MTNKEKLMEQYRVKYLTQDIAYLENQKDRVQEIAHRLQAQGLLSLPEAFTFDEVLVLDLESKIRKIESASQKEGFRYYGRIDPHHPEAPIEQLQREIQGYQRRLGYIESDLRTVEFLHPHLKQIQPLEQKKVAILPTRPTRGAASLHVLYRVIQLYQGTSEDSLNNADVMIYWGRYLCDYRNDGTEIPMIDALLQKIRSSDIPAAFFFVGRDVERYCYPHCPEPKEIYQLQKEGKKIALIPRATI